MTAQVAVALDLASVDGALAVVDACAPAITWAKVGPVLFVRDGPALVGALRQRGIQVFLDLKWHDIPNTVAGAVAAAADLGVTLATVHLAGGSAMLRAATEARRGGIRLVGVGVLTSMDAAAWAEVTGRPAADVTGEQRRLLALGRDAGLDGFVCAASEARVLREAWGGMPFVVTPGIRRAGDAAGDQRRTATPAEAVAGGADLLVIGRPITAAADPAASLQAVLAEMGS